MSYFTSKKKPLQYISSTEYRKVAISDGLISLHFPPLRHTLVVCYIMQKIIKFQTHWRICLRLLLLVSVEQQGLEHFYIGFCR